MIIKYYKIVETGDKHDESVHDAAVFFNKKNNLTIDEENPQEKRKSDLNHEQNDGCFESKRYSISIRLKEKGEMVKEKTEEEGKTLFYETLFPVEFDVDSETLAPILTKKPESFEEMKFLVSVDPRFLCQLDAKGLLEEQTDELLRLAFSAAIDIVDDSENFASLKRKKTEEEVEDDFICFVAISAKKFLQSIQKQIFEKDKRHKNDMQGQDEQLL